MAVKVEPTSWVAISWPTSLPVKPGDLSFALVKLDGFPRPDQDAIL
jgi:hypothetical protein